MTPTSPSELKTGLMQVRYILRSLAKDHPDLPMLKSAEICNLAAQLIEGTRYE